MIQGLPIDRQQARINDPRQLRFDLPEEEHSDQPSTLSASFWSWSPATVGPIRLRGMLHWPDLIGERREWMIFPGMEVYPPDGNGASIRLRHIGNSRFSCDINFPPGSKTAEARLLKRNRTLFANTREEKRRNGTRIETALPPHAVVLVELSWQEQRGVLQTPLSGTIPAD